MLTHKQRIENALSLRENDRVPYSLWMHFPNRDRHPRRLAELTLNYQSRYDLDFIKFMPYGMYSAVDLGADIDVFPGYEDAPVLHEPVITELKDWDKIRPISGTAGEYSYVLEAQRLLMESLEERVPFIQTVFSPMTTLAKLCSPKTLVEHLRQDPRRIHRALEIVTTTTLQFVNAVVRGGADGLFFASQLSGRQTMTGVEHEDFVRKYDLEILNSVKGRTWFNVLHLHGPEVRIDEVQDYPIQALNWHDRDDGPSMDEVRKYSTKAFIGGLSQGKNWLNKTEAEVAAEVRETVARNGGKGIILGPGCVIEPHTPERILELVVNTARETAGK